MIVAIAIRNLTILFFAMNWRLNLIIFFFVMDWREIFKNEAIGNAMNLIDLIITFCLIISSFLLM